MTAKFVLGQIMIVKTGMKCQSMQLSSGLHCLIKTKQSSEKDIHTCNRECSGSVLECLTRDKGVGGSSLTGVTAFCP